MKLALLIGLVIGFLVGFNATLASYHVGHHEGYGTAMADVFFNLTTPEKYLNAQNRK